jgi:hypothetical protein
VILGRILASLVSTFSASLLYRSDCKVRTQEAENFDEEDKSLVSAWRLVNFMLVKFSAPGQGPQGRRI